MGQRQRIRRVGERGYADATTRGGTVTNRTPPPFSDARRQHLDFIQTVIGRMSSASAVAKGWALTIATAAYGYAGTKASAVVALLGMFAVLLFAAVDARYLREERKYRLLFDAARLGTVDDYEMNATRYCGSLTRAQRESIGWGQVLWSWSVRDYYGLILLVGVALLVWLHCR
jgi:hypothetical protein